MKRELLSLPNIGDVMAEKLSAVGIDTVEDLIAAGSENAFIRLKALDEGACIHSLFALEGAIRGVRWHDLEPQVKEELRTFFNMTRLSGKL